MPVGEREGGASLELRVPVESQEFGMADRGQSGPWLSGV